MKNGANFRGGLCKTAQIFVGVMQNCVKIGRGLCKSAQIFGWVNEKVRNFRGRGMQKALKMPALDIIRAFCVILGNYLS